MGRNKGYKHTEATRLKMSLSSIGKKKSISARKSMSIAQIKSYENGRKSPFLILKENNPNWFKGENNPKWIKDRTKIKIGDRKLHDPNYKQWHKNVKNRDGWKCRISNSNCSGRLEAHHILSWKDYPELRYDINNGITLCHAHHPRTREDEAKLSPYFKSLVASLN